MAKRKGSTRARSESSAPDITQVRQPRTFRRSSNPEAAAAIEGSDPFPDGYVAASVDAGIDTDDDAEVGQRMLSHNERAARRAARRTK